MRLAHFLAACTSILGVSCSAWFEKKVEANSAAAMNTLHAFRVQSLDGRDVDLAQYKGRVVLIVNTASECGFTPQYAGLQKLHDSLAPKGFEVLGFPSNEFGGQEPGGASEIASFCQKNYGVTFPLFAKSKTKAGDGQSPMYAWLGSATGKLPAWNFGKYLVGKDGRAIAFYASNVKPDDKDLAAAIDKALAAP